MALDEEMKKVLKEMIENDEACIVKLKELEKNGDSYDKLWDNALCSEVSICLCQLVN